MKERDLGASVFLLCFSLFFWLQVIKLPFGVLSAPESGLWPLVLAVLLSVGSVAYFFRSLKGRGAGQAFFSRPGSWRQIALALAVLFLFAFLLQRMGYLLSTFALIAILLRTLRPQRWWVVLGTACVSAVVSYLLFDTLLGIDLPKGILGI